jgi:hypothetical protein
VLLRSFDEDAGRGLEPEPGAVPRTGGVAVAIHEHERQLAAVLVTERGGVEREQQPERPRAQVFALA